MGRKRHNNSEPKEKTLVDIVVTTAGRFDMLAKCLERLKNETLVGIKVHIVDNASPAEERILNQSLFEGFDSKRLQTNVGFPAACNEGARMGNAEFILFLSDDVVLNDDAISQLIKSMDDPQVGVVGAKLLFPEDSTDRNRPAGKVQHIGLAINIKGDIIHPLIGWSKDNPKTCVSRDVFAVTGACFLIRRNLFNQAGGFDKAFGLGCYEDANLCLTVRSLGFRIVINTNAIGYHYVGATAEKRKESFPLGINSMLFKSRWIQTPYMLWDSWSYY